MDGSWAPHGRVSLATWVGLVVGAVAVVFVLASAAVLLRASPIDGHARSVREEVLPTLHAAATLQTGVRDLEAALERMVEGDPSNVTEAREALARAHARFQSLPTASDDSAELPGETEAMATTRRTLTQLEVDAEQVVGAASSGNLDNAQFMLEEGFREDRRRAQQALTELSVLNAIAGDNATSAVLDRHRETQRLAIVLNASALLLALALAAAIVVFARRHTRLEQQHCDLLERRTAELDAFAARVAHDLVSPMAALRINIATLRRICDSDPRARLIAERCDATIERGRDLVDALLSFARAGAEPEPGASAELEPAIREVATGVAESEPNLRVVLGEMPSCVVGCSRGAVESIAANLIENAAKYTRGRSDRAVEVSAELRDGCVHCEVADNGPGLPAGSESRVFEPYVRGVIGGAPGLGLGLATVKRLVHAHRGAVGVKNRPGSGATFWFELPVIDVGGDARISDVRCLGRGADAAPDGAPPEPEAAVEARPSAHPRISDVLVTAPRAQMSSCTQPTANVAGAASNGVVDRHASDEIRQPSRAASDGRA